MAFGSALEGAISAVSSRRSHPYKRIEARCFAGGGGGGRHGGWRLWRGIPSGHLLAGDFGLFERRGETCPGANESPERELQVDRKPDLGLRPCRDADEGGPVSLGVSGANKLPLHFLGRWATPIRLLGSVCCEQGA